MKDRWLILIFAVAIFCAVWSKLISQGNASTPDSQIEGQGAAATQDNSSHHFHARDEIAYERLTRAYQEELATRQAALKLRAQAGAKTESERSMLAFSRQVAWGSVVSSNWATYQQLRRQAEHTPTGHVHCTICDGVGRLNFCILCDHSDGKCLTCRGTGRIGDNEICPTCMGTGKCFFCGGTGKMLCPFCDDGIIYVNGHLPLSQPPVH